jgi:NhaP-type Na+/H+ or K+/H+ antiporter
MTPKERLFLSWFGVRGVAALFYAAYVVDKGVLDSGEATTVFWTTAAVVMVSLVLHGISAAPLTRRWLDPRT